MTREPHIEAVTGFYDAHPINETQIVDKLVSDGIDLDRLSEKDLQRYDQDHYGGVAANDALARLAGIDETSRVLDVCSGMGGPARYLAHQLGCRVTGIDLTPSRVAGARRLTEMAGLAGRVDFVEADALANPFPDRTFDVVVSQEAFAHIPNRSRLIGECARVLKPGGRLAFTDIVARDGLSDASRDRLGREMAFAELETFDGYRRLLEDAGCATVLAEDMSAPWSEILIERLAMYRGLKDQTVARLGAAEYQRYDTTYSFFVGLYRSGELGGARFLARREGP